MFFRPQRYLFLRNAEFKFISTLTYISSFFPNTIFIFHCLLGVLTLGWGVNCCLCASSDLAETEDCAYMNEPAFSFLIM